MGAWGSSSSLGPWKVVGVGERKGPHWKLRSTKWEGLWEQRLGSPWVIFLSIYKMSIYGVPTVCQALLQQLGNLENKVT